MMLVIISSCSNPTHQVSETMSMKPNVLLIHGVLMNPLEMRFLGSKLKKAGFNVHYVMYSSVSKTSEENAKAVQRRIKQLNLPQLHIVAHSLGGIVTLHLLDQFDDVPEGRVVMLGSPLNGSLIAKRVKDWFIISPLLARSMSGGLSGENIPLWKNNRDWGMISGNKNFGIATLTGGLPKESDGTVMVDETRHPKQTDHIIIKASHTGLLFSTEAAQLTANFLLTGMFKKW